MSSAIMNISAGFVRHFLSCNRHDFSGFVPFCIGEKRYGWAKKAFAEAAIRETPFFREEAGSLILLPRFSTFEDRSEALLQAAKYFSAKAEKPLRDEFYPVVEKWGDVPVAKIDRLAVPWFGIRAWGIHVNGFVRKSDGLYLWIGERASDRQVSPGKLDNLIGGGLPIGLTRDENLCKEAREEADLEASLAQTAKPVHAMDYILEMPDGLRTDTLFLYDLDLPENFVPKNTDGEVAAFYLLPIAEVAEIIRTTDRFKFNCNMVIVDFLIRHGHVRSNNPEFYELKKWLDDKTHKF